MGDVALTSFVNIPSSQPFHVYSVSVKGWSKGSWMACWDTQKPTVPIMLERWLKRFNVIRVSAWHFRKSPTLNLGVHPRLADTTQ
jgi:hypothetical protein